MFATYAAHNGAGYSPSATGEKQAVLLPTDWKADGTRRCVITAHGLLGDAYGTTTGWKVGMFELRTFAALGFACINSDLGGPTTWGNDTAQDRIDDCFTYMKANHGVAPDKFIGYGQSMGGPTMLNYMRAKPYNVAAFAGQVAGIGLDDLHDRSAANPFDSVIGAMAGSIEGAYGGLAAYNAAVPTHDPFANRTAYAQLSIPTRLWVSEDDPVWPIAIARQFVAEGFGDLASIGFVGHNILPAGYYMRVAEFMRPYVFRRKPINRNA